MVFGPMNKCLKLSIYLGRVIIEEQWLKKFHIFSPKSDFRITIVCPSVWNQNPLTSEITFIWSLISKISHLSYHFTYQLSDQLLQLLSFFGLLHFIFRFPTFFSSFSWNTLIIWYNKEIRVKMINKCFSFIIFYHYLVYWL